MNIHNLVWNLHMKQFGYVWQFSYQYGRENSELLTVCGVYLQIDA